METEEYRSRYEVYLYGICALFPGKLNGRILSADYLGSYIEYFPLFTDENQVKALKEYEARKMFKVEFLETRKSRESSALDALEKLNTDSLIDDKHRYKFRITDIDQNKFKANLVEYLQKFSEDKLTIKSLPVKPEAPEVLKRRLHAFIEKTHRKRPKVTLYDIWPNEGDRNVLLNPFWELILSSELIFHEIKIYDIGEFPVLDKKVGSGSESLPYTEVENRKKAPPSKPEPPNTSANIVASRAVSDEELQTVTVGMSTSGTIYAELPNGVKRQIKTVRRDSSHYNFMNYMLGHQKQDISRGDINTNVDGCEAKKNMTDLAMHCGFTKDLLALKPLYFGGTTETNARFKATTGLNPVQVELLMKRKAISA